MNVVIDFRKKEYFVKKWFNVEMYDVVLVFFLMIE